MAASEHPAEPDVGGTAPLVGVVLDGRYRVLKPLGEGGMGAVFLTRDERLARDVVIKVPHASQALSSGFRQRFKKEIQSLTTLDHPNIVKVLDMGETPDGVPYAVMPYLAGGSLKERLEALAAPPSVEQLGAWLAPIADALDSIHRKGFVHRDVKPGNLLFDEEGHPYLADFGLVKVLHSGDTSLTQSGFMPGSPQYMAPEAVTGLEAGPAYDQYSLGTVAYEALTGSLPITGQTAVELLVKKRSEAPRPIEESRPDLPVPLKSALMRALERDPARRFRSCAEMVTAAGLAVPDLARSVAVLTPPRLPSGLSAPRPPWRRPWAKVGAAAVALVGLGVGAFALLGSGPSGPTLAWIEPVEGQVALQGERIRLRLKADGLEPGDTFLVNGQPRAGLGGWLNALVDAGTGTQQPVEVRVLRDGEEVARAALTLALEPVPRPEVPEWARISREQLLEARRIGVPVAFENPLGMRFVLAPGGTVEIGSPAWEPERQPWDLAARVTLTDACYVQTTPASNAQVRRWRPTHRSPPIQGLDGDGDALPATGLNHAEALEFAAWVSAQDGQRTYTLPSEAQFECAARAGTRGRYWWGDDPLLMGQHENVCDRATLAHFPTWSGSIDVQDGHVGTAPVGSLAPNAWGLYDLAGNVKQWCRDEIELQPGIPAHVRDAVDPVHTSSSDVFLVRGNSWTNSLPDRWSRVGARGAYGGDGRDPSGGSQPVALAFLGTRLVSPVRAPPRPGRGGDPVVLLVQEPAMGEIALEGQWIRVRTRVEGWREGDIVRVDGEPHALLQGWLNCLVKAGESGEQQVEIAIERAGAELARAERRVTVEPVPRPEVPDWARVSHEQLREARRCGIPVAFENPLGMRFVLVPSGTFDVGSPTWEPHRRGNERRGHITLTRPWYMQAMEVTCAQVRAWRPEYAPESVQGEVPERPDDAAVGLTHPEAEAFAAWVSERDASRRYRLPTEIEWERAARGGTAATYPWGDDVALAGRFENVCDLTTLRRFTEWEGERRVDDGVAGFALTGSLRPNTYGLHDLLGNVMEWCQDAYHDAGGVPAHPRAAVDPPLAQGGEARALRGCSWMTVQVADALRPASRGCYLPDGTDPETDRNELHAIGFRLVVPWEGAPPTAPPAPPAPAGPDVAAVTLDVEAPTEGQVALDGEWVHVRARTAGLAPGDVVEVDGEAQALSGPYVHTGLRVAGPEPRRVRLVVRRRGAAVAEVERVVAVEPVPRPEVPGWARVSKRQLDEARRLGKPVAFEDEFGMRFVLIPAGEFWMGSPEWEQGRNAAAEARHRVRITRPYYLGAGEVPNAVFLRMRPEHANGSVAGSTLDDPRQPVVRLRFADAQALATWLGRQGAAHDYRLPTEAEWEHAARAGGEGSFPWGEAVELTGRFENVADLSAKALIPQWTVIPVRDGFAVTSPGGALEPNAWGIWDAGGNAIEWVADWFGSTPPAGIVVDPRGPESGQHRVARGASYAQYDPHRLRAARRMYLTPSGVEPETLQDVSAHLGVRLVAVPR